MKKIIFLLAAASVLILSACQAKAEINTLPEPVPDQEQSASAYGLGISLEEDDFQGTPGNLTAILKNTGDATYGYGTFYQLEYKIDGLWYIVPYRESVFAKYPGFNNMGEYLKPGDTVTQSYSPESFDLKFPKGEYRLVKTFIYGDSSYTVSIAAPFEVQ